MMDEWRVAEMIDRILCECIGDRWRSERFMAGTEVAKAQEFVNRILPDREGEW